MLVKKDERQFPFVLFFMSLRMMVYQLFFIFIFIIIIIAVILLHAGLGLLLLNPQDAVGLF
jgi:hypothetical protein